MNKPNILLISIDTLRADHLSCYGNRCRTTPNLDRIAEEGLLFTSAYTTASWTPPSHASMFTGLYPSQHGVVDEYKLNARIPTLAEILSNNGYLTCGFSNNSMVGNIVGLDRGHQFFDEVWVGAEYSNIVSRGLGFLGRKLVQLMGKSDEGAKVTTRRALKWLGENICGSMPFYLFIHHIDVHNPMKAPRPFRYRFLSAALKKKLDMAKIWRVADNPLICLTDHLELNNDEIEALQCIYDEELAYVDFKIGQVLNFLRQRHVLDDTLLIITADHGEHFGEHNLYSHVASLYEPVLHIPMILRYPRLVEGGMRSEKLVQLVDIFPTVLDLLDLQYTGDLPLHSRSLLSEGHESRDLYAEWEGRVPHFVRNRLGKNVHPEDLKLYTTKQNMIRSGKFKLIVNARDQAELYDLEQDPLEQTNLASAQPERVTELKNRLSNWLESNHTEKERELYELSSEAKRNLEGLGYI
ncbi:MAG: sulfatase [bacterium]